jgi:hypothetical protein
MPYLNYLTLESFAQHHPEWEMILIRPLHAHAQEKQWASGEQAGEYAGVDYCMDADIIVNKTIYFDFSEIGFSNTMHDVHKADLLRQYLLYKEGGMWCDMDVLWVKPIEELDCTKDVDIMLCWNAEARRPYFSTGICMARPGTDYHKTIYEACPASYNPTEYQSLGPFLLRNIFPTVDSIKEKAGDDVIINAPYTAFYPVHYSKLHKLYQEAPTPLPNNTVAVHWFGGAELSRYHMKKISPDTLPEYSDTLIGELINEV